MKSIKKIEVIAEIAQSHGGSLEKAKKMILLCKKAGADYVKFQAHYAKYESHLMSHLEKVTNLKKIQDMIIGKNTNLQKNNGKF